MSSADRSAAEGPDDIDQPEVSPYGDHTAEAIAITSAIFSGVGRERDELLALAEPEDFLNPRHRLIWQAIRRLVAAGGGTATTMIRDEIEATNPAVAVDTDYINRLTDHAQKALGGEPYKAGKLGDREVRDLVFTSTRRVHDLATRRRTSH
ncbi:DnaB-like helicase N-terminal domain-containing protein [Tenggerimyces flavus]|uniref:DnaB-like helicase N-terminal domain-containing protein n=1 Tax=Tenggerimyces flavus TaxID=1708749 RepID=A0ABV7YRT3_9ACTN|nr:DnaB-like helicase N-terminal domain-containing protein [Tenggerimyces flavus]MBM7790200.1 hypothetical protein [Tenggerimyces flavus]